jgi:hypothetical protein
MLRRRLTVLAACLAAFAVPHLASAQSNSYFGPQVGFFFPASKELRDALGDSWFSFGASRLRTFELRQRKLSWDWNAIGQSRDGNTVFILTLSAGYVASLAQLGASTEPYVALRGGVSYMDFAVDTTSGREADKALGLNANAAFGLIFNKRFNIEARYDVWDSKNGLVFNGLTLSARFGLVKF